jgi:hypothetical protein
LKHKQQEDAQLTSEGMQPQPEDEDKVENSLNIH